ncbi:LysM peptidoglycan-binding domain-containing protein [Desulfotomaculum copahuensis]|uniref:Terminase n=1 Tax=Desulfotomaculum copahuensis TaxID=1838280 RepID=A0A1B7LDH0_9FIRM|nr:LysM peptidoglycan-binding domain-containing protein [Desulfotomaculum copahuensis]OAT81140.1 terminase [Desulfotomaculum copahuensis]
MDFYLLSPDGQDLHFPVNPPEVTVEGAKKIETVSIINIGDVDFPVGDELTGISFSSFFPRDYDPSYCQYASIPTPETALGRLNAWRTAGKPVRLLITETSVNVLVLITRVAHRYVGGEPGDIYFELAMRQWRDVKVRSVTNVQVATQSAQTRPRPDTKPIPKVYVVKPGDSLWKIAKLQLGNGSRWQDIYANNKRVIGPNPNLIYPGQRLVMPA